MLEQISPHLTFKLFPWKTVTASKEHTVIHKSVKWLTSNVKLYSYLRQSTYVKDGVIDKTTLHSQYISQYPSEGSEGLSDTLTDQSASRLSTKGRGRETPNSPAVTQ